MQVSQTILAHRRSINIKIWSSVLPVLFLKADFMAYIIKLPCTHRPRKHELNLARACSVPITHTSADYESQPNEPQQRSEVATHRGRPQNPPITQFFIKAIFQKAERGERTHSSSKPHSGKQLLINRDTVREWRAILGQTWKQTLSEF